MSRASPLGHVDGDRVEVDAGAAETVDTDRVAPLRQGGVIRVAEHRVDVVYLAESLKERDQVQELRVGHVVEPRGHWNLQNDNTVDKRETVA